MKRKRVAWANRVKLVGRVLVARAAKTTMARKKKKKRFEAVTAVKELARERVGSPPSGKIVIEKNKKPEKYKPTLDKLLQTE
jgi:hypothetical protein